MKYPNVYKDLSKVEKIVLSCKTSEQLAIGEKVLDNFVTMYPTLARISFPFLIPVFQPWKKDVTNLYGYIFRKRVELIF